MNQRPLVFHIEGREGQMILTGFANRKSGIFICETGSASVSIGTKRHELKPGDMLLVIPFSNPTFPEISRDFTGTLCIVDFEYVFSAVSPVNLTANMKFVITHPVSHPAEHDFETILDIIRMIETRSRYIGKRPLAEMTIDNLVSVLAYLVLDSYHNVNQKQTRSSDPKESIMLAFHTDLARHYTRYRKVGQYAALQNLSPRYFSATVKAVSGYSPLFWINTAVAGEAKRLMRESKLSIKEIAYSLNFASPTFFTRWYRDFAGETPSDYRSRYRITLSRE